jgi:bacillopeptidase F
MRRLYLFTIATLLLAGTLLAGTLSPGLERFLTDRTDGEMVKIMLAMTEQADIATLDEQLHREQASLAQRHQLVVSALQQTAASSQVALINDLEQLRTEGLVNGWASHWITNIVIVEATVATVRQLAARPDVERAEVDLIIQMIEPVEVNHDPPVPHSRSIRPGIDNIEADRVWYELGIYGEGAIVAGIDTGVMGSHVSFATRWQGNGAVPDSEGWLDTIGGTTTPNDGHGHGTHTMGTMVGASSDTIGVAPGANWIATNPIDQGTGGGFDSDVIAALEWVCDPDGDPGTTDDMADVAQNSWGVNEGFGGYYDCDSRWWDAIDNCEAAGTVLTWSAGNEGPGSTSLRSPADRADTPYNCFSVGSTIKTPPFTISSFSSRGPSGCGGPYATKPEVCAPGSDIYSAYNNGGYTSMSGTSMSGPHVAGVVALMRSANPNVDVNTIKQILMDTSTDLGTTGEDNTYGWGFVNAYEAVLAVMNGATYHDHEITSEDNGNGIPDIGETVELNVRLRNIGAEIITDATGELSCSSPWITFNSSFSTYDSFGPEEVQVNNTPYSLNVDAEAPPIFETTLLITVFVEDTEREFSIPFSVGEREQYYLYDCESGAGGWTHNSADGWSDQWHLSSEDANSPTNSWKCGDAGTGTYGNSLDARLISEPLQVYPLSKLVIQHRIDAETSTEFPDSAYDGGIVEVSLDGENWEQLAGSYNKYFRWESGGGNPATHPFPGGIPCFSGSFDWEEAEFDLEAWSGETVQFRFRFGSDGGAALEGWYLDDVALWGYVGSEPGEPLVISIAYSDPYVTVIWEPEAAADGYRVYRSTTPYGPFTMVQEGTASSYTAVATGGYFYYVTWF